ncbi:MAG: hypothetical protein N4A62_00485 [Marinisporobacter sp.]|nr:hypothetical protein [Marinisporobacter sp.]
MKKEHKKIINIIIGMILYAVVFYYGRVFGDGYHDLKGRMYHNFEDFGIELEVFNDELSKILILNEYDHYKEKVYMNENIRKEFYRSNYNASDMGNGHWATEYNFMYGNVNDVIQNILSDEKITPTEEKYLKNLYAYTEELIKEYRQIVGNSPESYNYKKQRKLEKQIVDIYNDYSQKADDLLCRKEYSFLKTYHGDFKHMGFKKAKTYCEEIFSKLVLNQILKHDNQEDVNHKEYVFKTSLKEGLPSNLKQLQNDQAEYEVSYNKITKKVKVRATSYHVPPKRKKESEIDKIADETIKQFNKNAIQYKRKAKYDKTKLDYIEYMYIEKINDLYDETKKIKMDITGNGLVSYFEIMDFNDQKMIMPIVTKEEILSKINPKATINDCNIKRNEKGKIEYVVDLTYKDTLYKAIFDGEDGSLTYYKRYIKKTKMLTYSACFL